jgi:hypothetical protein
MIKSITISEWTLQELFSDGQWCPVCGKDKFTALEPFGGVWCDECGATFEIGQLSADPGVAITCKPENYPQGIHNGRPVLYYIDPKYFYENKVVFWQILKDCDGGLDNRNRWCANKTDMRVYKKNGHLGIKVARFDALLIARHKLQKQKDQFYVPELELLKLKNDLSKKHTDGYYKMEDVDEIVDHHLTINLCIPKVGAKPIYERKD